MPANAKMYNRQIGRNAQLLAEAIGRMETAEERYPYLRSLLAVIEDGRPEWAEAAHRTSLYAHLVRELSGADLAEEEIVAAVRARDAERELAAGDYEAAEEAGEAEKGHS